MLYKLQVDELKFLNDKLFNVVVKRDTFCQSHRFKPFFCPKQKLLFTGQALSDLTSKWKNTILK